MNAKVFVAVVCLVNGAALGQAGEQAAGQSVLTAEHFWRKHYTYMPPAISAASAKARGQPMDRPARVKAMAKRVRTGLERPPRRTILQLLQTERIARQRQVIGRAS